MTSSIRTAQPADLALVETTLAAVGGAPGPLGEAVAAGRVLVATALAAGGGAGSSSVARAGLAGIAVVTSPAASAAGSAAWLWVAPGAGRAAVARALAVAALAGESGARLGRDVAHERPPSLASIHVQTDDVGYVERTIRQVVPRLGRSAGTATLAARNGWIGVYDELCDRDRKAQRRLAEELSVRLGLVVVALAVEEGEVVRMLLYERGRMVDEYLSVPAWAGPLPPGEALALAVNPTLVARLTGADPGAVRAVARTAESTAELPPADALAGEIASLLGLHGGAAGYAWAAAAPGAALLDHG